MKSGQGKPLHVVVTTVSTTSKWGQTQRVTAENKRAEEAATDSNPILSLPSLVYTSPLRNNPTSRSYLRPAKVRRSHAHRV